MDVVVAGTPGTPGVNGSVPGASGTAGGNGGNATATNTASADVTNTATATGGARELSIGRSAANSSWIALQESSSDRPRKLVEHFHSNSVVVSGVVGYYHP